MKLETSNAVHHCFDSSHLRASVSVIRLGIMIVTPPIPAGLWVAQNFGFDGLRIKNNQIVSISPLIVASVFNEGHTNTVKVLDTSMERNVQSASHVERCRAISRHIRKARSIEAVSIPKKFCLIEFDDLASEFAIIARCQGPINVIQKLARTIVFAIRDVRRDGESARILVDGVIRGKGVGCRHIVDILDI